MSQLALRGRRVLVTRAAHQAGKLSDGLRALGTEPVEVPVLEIGPPASFAPLDAALRQLSSYHWLILTSANTVRAVMDRVRLLAVPVGGARVAAVGPATARAAADAGLRVDLVPEAYVAESLVESLAAPAAGRRFLLARAEAARDVIPEALRAAGAAVDVVDAYRNAMPAGAPGQLRRALAEGINAATFTSSSSVTHLADAAQAAGLLWPFEGVKAVSIGPITSQTLRGQGWPPAAEAEPYDIPGLIAAVLRVLAQPGAPRQDSLP